MAYECLRLTEVPSLSETAAQWFHDKWKLPIEAYRESIKECLNSTGAVPQWYLALENGRIIGGMGVIENDFHERKDLTPNVCAVYTEPDCRNRGVAGSLLRFVCKDMARRGVDTLYLLTDHVGFYERYGWKFFTMVKCDGEETLSRMYVHKEHASDF